MAECELPEVVVENMYLFLIDDMREVTVEDSQYDFFDLYAFSFGEPFVTSLVGASQQISQFSRLEVIADYFLIYLRCQEASDVLHHFFCIDIPLEHGIGSVQIVRVGVHQAHFAVRIPVCAIIHGQCFARFGDHRLEVGMLTHGFAGIVQ